VTATNVLVTSNSSRVFRMLLQRSSRGLHVRGWADAVAAFKPILVFSGLVQIPFTAAVNISCPAVNSSNMVNTRCTYPWPICALISCYVGPTPVVRYMLTEC
jgi:hypothetical protein